MSFGIDGDGNYGYYGAAGSLVPFRKAFDFANMKTYTGTTGTSTGKNITCNTYDGKTKKVQFREVNYKIPGTIHAIWMHITDGTKYTSMYTAATNTVFTAQAATGYAIFLADDPVKVTNDGFVLPLYTDSGPGANTFDYTIYYTDD